MQQSLAEKALFSTLPGKFTKKTLARVYRRIFGGRCPEVGTPGFLLYPSRDFPILERCAVGCFSRADYRASQVRVGCLKFQRFLDMYFKF